MLPAMSAEETKYDDSVRSRGAPPAAALPRFVDLGSDVAGSPGARRPTDPHTACHNACMTAGPVDRYPRDMIGYGPHPPDPHWPGGARIAVQFVLNYEEGAENSVLHGDPASETFLSEIIAASCARLYLSICFCLCFSIF